jgi:tetratricopeptide (TPR) repeat protein
MVQARGGVKITLREIPLYGIVVVDPLGQLPADAGVEPFLLSIDGNSIENQSLSNVRALLCGQPGTPITLDIVSADLEFHQFVTLLRTPTDFILASTTISTTLDKCFELLDTVDSGDWPRKFLDLAEQSANTFFEPLSSTLYKVSAELSRNWLVPQSMVHLFTQIAAAKYFDKVYKVKEADLAVELALENLPDFDCLDFAESAKLFDFVDHLITTGRLTQASFLSQKLLDTAKNSVDCDTKTVMALRRRIFLTGDNLHLLMDEFFERSQRAALPGELNFSGDLYLRHGDFKKATQAYSAAILARLVPGCLPKGLKDFVQPSAYSGFVQTLAYEKEGRSDSARESLADAIAVLQNEFSVEQIALIDQLPGFFPKPKDLRAKLAGVNVKFPDATADEDSIPFYIHVRSVLDALSVETNYDFDAAIAPLLSHANRNENAIECESLIWIGLLNVARLCIQEKRFDNARKILERISQQPQGLNCAPLYLVTCLTEMAVFSDQLGIEPEHCWSGLEAVLLNYSDVDRFHELESRELPKELQTAQLDTVRHTTRAKILRHWSQVYLRSNDYERAEKILMWSLHSAEKALKLNPTTTLSELIRLIHGDLAVAQINLARQPDAERSIEKIFDKHASFFGKTYQIAEAYRIHGLSEQAELLLARSILLPAHNSTIYKRTNFSEGGFHIWKLAELAEAHKKRLNEATQQFPSSMLPPVLACMAGDYAESQGLFDQAARHFRSAARFSQELAPGVGGSYLKARILQKAINAAECDNCFSGNEIRDLVIDLADCASLTNRQLAIINYRRAIALSSQSRQKELLEDLLNRITAGQPEAEQLANELQLASQTTKEFQVRTERYWMNKAAEELLCNKIVEAITHINHAIEIFRLSSKNVGDFHPLIPTEQDSVTELLRYQGFTADAESFLLESVNITTTKYGVASKEESLCLAELAHFYFLSDDTEKSMLVVQEILRTHSALRKLSINNPNANSSPIIFRLHQLALRMTAGGRIDAAIELLEAILKEEKKVLPSEHIDLVSTLLLLGKFRKENNQFELSDVIFEHVFANPLDRQLHSTFLQYVPDYCEVLTKLGKESAARKIKYLFSHAADVAIAEQRTQTRYPDLSPEEKKWKRLGSTKKAKDRYIKAVEKVIETHPLQEIATEALEHLATFYVENNRLGQAGETYLLLIERLNTEVPAHSFRKVLCYLSLARCYTRLCMYEDVPELLLQAKQADPEIHRKFPTVDTTLSYIAVAVEAHLTNSAREDLKLAESLVDAHESFNTTKKREYLERICHYWTDIGEPDSAAAIEEKLKLLPSHNVNANVWNGPEEKASSSTHGEECRPKPNLDSPPPFAFLECVEHNFVNFESSVFESPAYIYLKKLANKLSESWFPPLEKQPTRLQMQFSVDKDGCCGNMQLTTLSSNKYANTAAEEAVQSSAPFESLPEEFGAQAILLLTINDANYCIDKFGITFESTE